MSTTQDCGNHVFQCDEPRCGETLETAINFDAARNLLRRAGWQPYKLPGLDEWQHRCSACMQERARRAARNGAAPIASDQWRL
jgi:hypothetical protein